MLEQKELFEKNLLDNDCNSIKQKSLYTLIELTEKITKLEGITETIIPFLRISRHTQDIPLTPGIMKPGFGIMLQGTKEFHLGKEPFYFNTGDFIASIIDIPTFIQVEGASKEFPNISLCINFTASEVAAVVMDANINFNTKNKNLSLGLFVRKSDEELLELFIRLLNLLDRPKDAYFLAKLIKYEMLYHLLTGDYGYLFYQQILIYQQSDGVGKVIEWIRENYTRAFTVEDLAKKNNMSVSGLHHKFKSVTSMGPIQYQKELRLREARRLMLSDSMDATTAAMEVGYESSSQFTREYKRLFGQPPLKDIRTLRKSYISGAIEGII
ncbi:AraC family transcriptional regulator [Clostridium sp. YIM B02551]|uniref:AraC family transcriptional regulator n=1 Tax=Clostridium sp. YIM B02551 TaxID=2910679 RepID=UPI001EEC78DB|nr:AraC family transcriptional regulator [Clostridium sp. YIM B02551]